MRHDDRGAQAIEFSLVVPAILLLTLVVVAVGQVALGFLGTHQLASTAARTAAVAHDTAVHDVLTTADASRIAIDPASGTRRPGDLVTVTLSRRVGLVLLGSIEVTASATHRTEDVP
ncbi:hypothetical protein BH23ACT9_BH23ACT9_03430 [soil metagenome]